MDSSELDTLAKKDELLSRRWGGVFALDEFPKLIEPGRIFVVNDQPRHIYLGHWRLVSTYGASAVWFCSYGTPPKNPNVIRSLSKLKGPLVYNARQLQEYSTTTCSMHAIFIGMMLARDLELGEIIEKFYSRTDLLQNDYMVRQYIKTVFRLKSVPPLFDKEFLSQHAAHE